jgi:hypothetical protein
MVNIFGTFDTNVAKRGQPGVNGVDGIKDIINWFPDMFCDLFRKNVNVLTLLINTIPPAKDSDVELSSNKEVEKWFSYNDREHVILTPVDEKVGKLDPRSDLPSDGYGIVFDKKQQIMYHIPHCKNVYLSIMAADVLLTLTFLVGKKEDDNDEVEEEFIVSDYRWSSDDKQSDMHRGVSVVSKSNKKFDLYLHGAVGDDRQNKMKIGKDLEQDAIYTLQICWKRVVIDTGFYTLYKYKQLLFDKISFKHNITPHTIVPAFYLGGFNASKDSFTLIKSKCFTGMISNIEVIQTKNSFSDDLLQLIVDKQSVFEPWSELKNNEEDEPPTPKRKKVM